MSSFFMVIIIIATISSSIWILLIQRKKIKLKKEEEERLAREREHKRKETVNFFRSLFSEIAQANSQFNRLLSHKSGYFSNYQLNKWNHTWKPLFLKVTGKPFKDIQLEPEEVSAIENFSTYSENGNSLRNDFNHSFIPHELRQYNVFFNNIEGKKLDEQQRTAIVKDEDNNMVIAGAGSGKTTTIVGKVNYVVDRYKVKSDEILLISFTNKSASTLADRIRIEGVEAKTFHKFGKDVIANVENRQPSIFDEKQFRPFLTKYFNELIQNQSYLGKVTEYFADYLKPPKSQFEFKDRGEYIQYLKDQNFRSYKLLKVPVRGRMTYKMEVVKSIEECKIANFLLFNGIDYKYEYPYQYDTATPEYARWKPDFTIQQNGKTIYLEHFAIDRSNNVPPFFANVNESYEEARNRYLSKIDWARNTNEEYGTTLIETYSYEMSEGTLYDNLSSRLNEVGITLSQKTPHEIWGIIQKSADDEIKNFITLVGTFITLMKSNNYSIDDVILKNKESQTGFFKKRNEVFIDIVIPIYQQYQDYLSDRSEIDFSDMINKASNYIQSREFKRPFKYVIIDEFQDISIGRYELVKAIKAVNPSCKLFAVGDDWQSIYRFSGSDITLFKEFDAYFGHTVKSKIETTYRFHNPLINLSSSFIQKNPNQAVKKLKGTSSTRKTKSKIIYSISENKDDTDALQKVFDDLIQLESDIETKSIFILGRYRFDIDRIKNTNGVFKINADVVSYLKKIDDDQTIRIDSQFLTIHKAKGLEADIVIILNCNSGKHGFPSEMSDDAVLNLLLSEADQFQNGEERRLFYVAMTRAMEHVYFIADSAYKSKFITELEVDSSQAPNRKCPNCKTADVILRKEGTARNGNRYKFYGCTNFLYGCDYSTTEWINLN